MVIPVLLQEWEALIPGGLSRVMKCSPVLLRPADKLINFREDQFGNHKGLTIP